MRRFAMFEDVLQRLGIQTINSGAGFGEWIAKPSGPEVVSINPANGQPLARVIAAGLADYETIVSRSVTAFATWRMVPAPQRGEIIRQLGDALRRHKSDLGM